ncbi:MAG: TIGR04084 family radical SAM/SPASM domain-containing protein [Methanomicrobiales archaeon]|nr:TIGR04084 family radical SAM/SPASM domain-containing protein [Methanomicrobiales archaeon]MDI6876947.1 TIGR04084 family radical SAM/SPASM domain-containing protein [Methanomicrobiales archaeon]
MFYHLILTDDCNLNCRYCRGKAIFEEGEPAVDIDTPAELAVDLDLLYGFLARDPDPVLMFYGGEPLLRADLVREILQHAPVRKFAIYTNGQILHRLEPEWTNRFSTVFVSIDGPEDLTDYYRGRGTYRRLIGNLQGMVAAGFSGEIIARMTVAEQTDIHSAVRALACSHDFSFSSIHWQLDANFSRDFEARDFGTWAQESYNPGIRRLVRDWVDAMRREGKVPRWYPFLDTAEDLLRGRTATALRCGSGHANYTILTDGSIAPCPCMVGMRPYYLGHIATSDPLRLPILEAPHLCEGCRIRSFCGGRCLYANVLQPWTRDQRRLVCGTVENLHDAIVEALPAIRSLLDDGAIALEDFRHDKYNGCEIIP